MSAWQDEKYITEILIHSVLGQKWQSSWVWVWYLKPTKYSCWPPWSHCSFDIISAKYQCILLQHVFLPVAKPTGLGEHLGPSSSVICLHLIICGSGWGMWLSQERWLPGKVDFPGKLTSQESWLPGKVDFPEKLTSRKSWLPRAKLTTSGKVDSLGKNGLPPEKF